MKGLIGGFLTGSLALIVLYVVVQPGVASKTEQGGNILIAGAKSLFEPGRAGIGNHAQPSAKATLKDNTTGSGGGGGTPKFT